jgi:hypothetical protein
MTRRPVQSVESFEKGPMMPIRSRVKLRTTLGLLGATLAAFISAQACGGGTSVSGKSSGKDPLATGGSAGGSGRGAGGSGATGANTGTGGSAAHGGSNATGSGATGGSIILTGNAGEAGQTGGGGAPNCGATALHAGRPIVNMLLVVDKSSSMSGTAEFPAGRWKTLGDALAVALDNAKSRISFGLEFFPFADDPKATPDTCETPTSMDLLVPVGSGDQTVPQIEDAFSTYAPAGGTPTADALAHALDYFQNGDGKDLPGTSYVLLATDGGPNCNTDLSCDASTCTINLENSDATAQCGGSCCDPKLDPAGNSNCLDQDRTVAQVKSLADAGVKTFVVGIPGSEFFGQTLDKLAVAGKETNPNAPPSYYQVTSSDGAQGLTDVLTQITSGLITSCRLQLTSKPDDPNYQGLLNVEIDGSDVPQQGPDGWTVDTTTSPPTIVLAGKTCDYMEQHGAENVQITYGCPTVMVK